MRQNDPASIQIIEGLELSQCTKDSVPFNVCIFRSDIPSHPISPQMTAISMEMMENFGIRPLLNSVRVFFDRTSDVTK